MKRIYVTSGISGSGKSKFAEYFCKVVNGCEVNADSIRLEHFGNVNYQGSDVWSVVDSRTVAYLAAGYTVILSNTNLHIKSIKDLLKKYPLNEIVVFIMKDSFDKELCWNRIQKDLTNNVNRSNVPREVLEKQFENFQNFVPLLKELAEENNNLKIKYIDSNFYIGEE